MVLLWAQLQSVRLQGFVLRASETVDFRYSSLPNGYRKAVSHWAALWKAMFLLLLL